MGWLRKRFGEGNTLAGLAMMYMVARSMVTPPWGLVLDAVASASGVAGVLVPANSNPPKDNAGG